MHYYCKKCGAVVDGKFCSCCGTRATKGLEEFRRMQRTRKNIFRKWCCEIGRNIQSVNIYLLSDACWAGCVTGLGEGTIHDFNPVAYERFEVAEEKALQTILSIIKVL